MKYKHKTMYFATCGTIYSGIRIYSVLPVKLFIQLNLEPFFRSSTNGKGYPMESILFKF